MEKQKFYQFFIDGIKNIFKSAPVIEENSETKENKEHDELFLRCLKRWDLSNVEKMLDNGYELKGSIKKTFYRQILEDLANCIIADSILDVEHSAFRKQGNHTKMSDLTRVLSSGMLKGWFDMSFLDETQNMEEFFKSKSEFIAGVKHIHMLGKSHYINKYENAKVSVNNWSHYNINYLYKYNKSGIFNNCINFNNGMHSSFDSGNVLLDKTNFLYRIPVKEVIEQRNKDMDRDEKMLFFRKYELSSRQDDNLRDVLSLDYDYLIYLVSNLVPTIVRQEVKNKNITPLEIVEKYFKRKSDIKGISLVVLRDYPETLDELSLSDKKLLVNMMTEEVNKHSSVLPSVGVPVQRYLKELVEGIKKEEKSILLEDKTSELSIKVNQQKTDDDLVNNFISRKKKPVIYTDDFTQLAAMMDFNESTNESIQSLKDAVDKTVKLLETSENALDSAKKEQYVNFVKDVSKNMIIQLQNINQLRELAVNPSDGSITDDFNEMILNVHSTLNNISTEIIHGKLDNLRDNKTQAKLRVGR